MRRWVLSAEEERDRLAALGDNVFPAFARFRRQAAGAHRTVPIVQLTRREPDPG